MIVTWAGREIELEELVAEIADEYYRGRWDINKVRDEMNKSDWTALGKWRNSVPDGFKANWSKFPVDMRMIIFAMAIINTE